MKIRGKPLDIDYDIDDVCEAVQSATIQDKARIARALIHDLTFRRDGAERSSFFGHVGPTDKLLLKDLIDPVGGYVEEN